MTRETMSFRLNNLVTKIKLTFTKKPAAKQSIQFSPSCLLSQVQIVTLPKKSNR